MRKWIITFRDSFWFLPTILGIIALALSQVLIRIDVTIQRLGPDVAGSLFYTVGVSGSRDILTAIGGSMLAVAATSFSITISVLAIASSTYGPRLVRNFMADRANQFVLGIYGATFLYCLLVLRSIRSETDQGGEFIPDLAVNVAVLLAVLDVAVLVFFIHHIANSIQVPTLLARVRGEMVSALDELYPGEPAGNAVDATTSAPGSGTAVPVASFGFVMVVDEDRLLDLAEEHDCRIEVRAGTGTHVVAGEALATVHGPRAPSEELASSIRAAYALAESRSPRQDITFAVQQLTEMAIRALSPSMNDPFTASNALDELAVGLVPLAQRPDPVLGRTGDEGKLRLVVARVPPAELIGGVLDAMRHYALDNPLAIESTIRLAERIGTTTNQAHLADLVVDHLARLRTEYTNHAEREADKAAEAARIDAALSAISGNAISGKAPL
ncbi:DUF2254 domain-containing protein [Hoyosella sp. G463]|uniref:DUF2254 domain-containing protein n=1 Tax=Lolliginicoccus lacisalsi TaxID=2742202 RepID=A0A927JD48_9ACTN|nr:DUF2254 domain-containing protein [Lolliginicoccus lacisalsi]MBD8507101.1 DUF2254 domain-containing protein [Lolliginicoccus lacisalsi]